MDSCCSGALREIAGASRADSLSEWRVTKEESSSTRARNCVGFWSSRFKASEKERETKTKTMKDKGKGTKGKQRVRSSKSDIQTKVKAKKQTGKEHHKSKQKNLSLLKFTFQGLWKRAKTKGKSAKGRDWVNCTSSLHWELEGKKKKERKERGWKQQETLGSISCSPQSALLYEAAQPSCQCVLMQGGEGGREGRNGW